MVQIQGGASGRMAGLTWILDLDLGSSTVCLVLLRLMGIGPKRLYNWARSWNTRIKVNPTQVHEQMNHPVDWSLEGERLVLVDDV